MKTLTFNLLKQICPAAPQTATKLIDPLNEAMNEYEINTTNRVSAFIARGAVETGQFRVFSENLNYSAEGLMKTWPKRFPTLEFAQRYHRNPEKIANYVYCDRLGNGNEASGDGWRCRGKGIFQTTGRANYEQVGLALMNDKNYFLDNADELAAPKYAALSAALFWKTRNLSKLADAGDIAAISKKINGGTHGLKECIAFYNTALKVLA